MSVNKSISHISLSFFLIIFLSLLFSSNTLVKPHIAVAQDPQAIGVEKVNPDQKIRYNIKRVSEKIKLTFIGIFNKNEKSDYLAKLTNRRLSELKYVAEKDKISYLETATSRYITFVGLLKESLNENSTHKERLVEVFELHPEILEQLRDMYPSQTAEWRFIQQAQDTSMGLVSFLSNQ